MSSNAAIVLAAGHSKRMGAFKPLLPFGDLSVIKSCIQNLRQGGVDEIVVVVGHRADEIREHLTNLRVNFALNDEPDSEMSVSIVYGARALSNGIGAVLVALADHPAVPSEVTRQLIQEWERGAKLIVPTWQQHGGHPVLLDASFREELVNLNATGGLKSLFDLHRNQVVRLPIDSPYIARDIDTWDDYVTLHRAVFGREPSE